MLSVVVALGGLVALAAGVPDTTDGPSFLALPLAAALAYGGTGAVLAWSARALVVRRVLLAIGLAQAVVLATSIYSSYGLAAAVPWPLTAETFWVGNWLWAPAYVAIGVVLPLVLPDGRPLWRPAAVLSATAVAWTALSWATTPYSLQDFPITNGLTNPVGVDAAASPVAVAGGALLVLTALGVALASAAVRWRRSTGAAREQLTWLLLGVGFTIALALSAFAAPPRVAEVLTGLAMLPFPLSVAVALVRHRLWDVDLVVSRSLVYGVLTSAVVGAYVVAVALVGTLVGDSADAPVLATAGVALLVLPLHTRVQRAVNRLVHGDVHDPYTALARLGDRLEATADPREVADRVLPELVMQVRRGLRVPYAGVELADGTVTEQGDRPDEVVRVPLEHFGTEVGALVVGGADVPRGERRLLDHLARQAAVAVHAVLLARDVQRARAVAATAREEERRRLRRDLHDGMGPVLAAVALQAETARDLVAVDARAATALLDRLVPRLNEAVADVRALVHDLRPPTLDELGLVGAVRELATRFTTPTRSVVVRAGALPPLPAAVDLAAYRIVAEALTNAAKHAQASSVVVALSSRDGCLELEVADDGAGVAPGRRAGVGLRSMRERAEELGGACAVHPAPTGGGTVVRAVLPLPRVDVAAQRTAPVLAAVPLEVSA